VTAFLYVYGVGGAIFLLGLVYASTERGPLRPWAGE
jgi:hypothetical protein